LIEPWSNALTGHNLAMTQPHLALPPFSAVLLAAGAGSRLGGRPKSLLEIDGVPLIARLIHALTEAGASELVVVLGHHAEAIGRVLAQVPASASVQLTVVTNACPDDGQGSSLCLGLAALGKLAKSGDDVLIALADQPLIDATDIHALLHAHSLRGHTHMTVPHVAGKPGNPVVIDAALQAEWLAADDRAVGQHWRRANPSHVHLFATDNDHYRVDIDTDADMARLEERTGRRLCWPTRLNGPH
jgi:molybdenum cofactor cytidylyltransferase